MYVQKIHAKARLPTVQNDNSYVVYASEDVKIPARGDAIVTTGLYLAVPPNHTVRATSGAEAFSHSIEVSEFCSVNYPNPHRANTDPKPVELSLKVYNLGKADYTVKAGSSVGRVLVVPTFGFEVLETDVAEIMRSPPKTVDRMEKKFTAPKTAISWFKKMYASEYDYVKTNFLSEKVVKEIEEYKHTPNYQTSTNKDNLEATWAWGHLDETVKERIRREMIVRNEQAERVAQMSGTDMSKIDKVEKTATAQKKTSAKAKAKPKDEESEYDSDKAVKEDDGSEDNEVRDEKVEGDPDEVAPEDGEREPVERIEDEGDNADEDAGENADESDEDEELDEPKPAAPKAAVPKAAVPKAAPKAAAVPEPVQPVVAKAKAKAVAVPVPEPEAPPARPKAPARPGKKPAARGV